MSVKQDGSLEILTKDDLVGQTVALIIGTYQDGRPKKIGLEVEMPFFDKKTLKPIGFAGEKSITAIFNELSARPTAGWTPMEVENGKVTALKSKTGMITLEPGGQIEFASLPKGSLSDLAADLKSYVRDIAQASRKTGVDVAPYGFHPHVRSEDCPYIHERSRFQALKPVFDAECGYAAWGQSSSVQVTLDSPSKEDAFAAFKLGLMLQPLAAAMCANSPFAGGTATGYQSTRRQKLLALDSPLYNVPEALFGAGFGLAQWAEHVLQVPMSFIVRDDQYIAVAPKPFLEMVGKPLPELAHLPAQEQYLTRTDLLDHLTGIKPEMLLKPNLLLEFRAADLGASPREWIGLAAFWTGIFYDPAAFKAAQDYVAGWSLDTYQHLRRNAARDGLRTAVGDRTAQQALTDLLTIAKAGLKRQEPGSAYLLVPLQSQVAKGVTPADKALEMYNKNNADLGKTLRKTMLFSRRKAA